MSTSSIRTTYDPWWQRLRPRLTIVYVLVALALLIISLIGHARLLSELGKTFGGFFWAIDTDGQVVVVSALPQSGAFVASVSLTNTDHIIGVVVKNKNGEVVYSRQQNQFLTEAAPLTDAYKQARPGDSITYTIQHSNDTTGQATLPAMQFSWEMWLENYGLALLAGISWLLVGTLLLVTAQDWTGAVEGITLLPPAMLFLLYSHWGNVQQTNPADIVFQLLWVPSFALLGAAFIHLSLTYRPEAMSAPRRRPRLMIDGLPYLPLIALVAFEWSSFLIFGRVAGRPHFIVALGYGVFGGVLSRVIGVT